MTFDWKDIQWFFEPDGSLTDIYVQEVDTEDWATLIDYLNDNFELTCSGEQVPIDKAFILARFRNEVEDDTLPTTAMINLGGIQAYCHFFQPDEIEFDIAPEQVQSGGDFEKVECFMRTVSEVLGKQVTLTAENRPELPFVKIDVVQGVAKVLTKKEWERIAPRRGVVYTFLQKLRLKFMLTFFRKRFEDGLLKAANEPFTSSKKSNNLW